MYAELPTGPRPTAANVPRDSMIGTMLGVFANWSLGQLAALAAGFAALVAVASFGASVSRRVLRLLKLSDAAATLTAVHSDAVSDKVAALADGIEDRSEEAGRVFAAGQRLTRSIRELRYLLGLFPGERDRLERALADVILPTGKRNK